VFDVYLNYPSVDKYYNMSPGRDYYMCELYHVEKRPSIMEHREL